MTSQYKSLSEESFYVVERHGHPLIMIESQLAKAFMVRSVLAWFGLNSERIGQFGSHIDVILTLYKALGSLSVAKMLGNVR